MKWRGYKSHNDRWISLLYHNVADEDTSLTASLGVTVTPDQFASTLAFCKKKFRFIGIEDIFNSKRQRSDGRTPILLTFDDAYASVRRVAAPICYDLGIPATFFVTGGLVDNRTLALDNLVAHVINTRGFAPIARVTPRRVLSLTTLLQSYVPTLSLAQRRAYQDSIAESAAIDPIELVRRERPYITCSEICDLNDYGFSIGNHTTSHIHCRALTSAEAHEEIVHNKLFLEKLTGLPVRAFAFPYGNREDATSIAISAIRRSGHTSAFLVHNRSNRSTSDAYALKRISLGTPGRIGMFRDISLLPRLREIKDKFHSTQRHD
jgi:peptidoglycan/xylan/chitin deacetylase (PgdA/CDA1 family)